MEPKTLEVIKELNDALNKLHLELIELRTELEDAMEIIEDLYD